MKIVPPSGPIPSRVLLAGEAPGREEYYHKPNPVPFVGKSGKEQDFYLERHGISTRGWRKTNVVQEFIEGNPDPTPEQIAHWTPALLQEVAQCQPKMIVAVGRFAARWWLGEDAELDTVHGLPHRAGAFDKTRRSRAPRDCIIVPVIHPAAGFYDSDARALIAWDYAQVARVWERVKKGLEVEIREDEHAGNEHYGDMTGAEFAYGGGFHTEIAIDTEGIPSNPWSIQISGRPGTGIVLRTSQEDFDLGIRAIQKYVDRGLTVILHNALFDIEMCRVMGLDLSRANLFDSMYAAYLLRLEPQALKALAWRWCGMGMRSYQETVGDAGRAKQVEYLINVLDLVSGKGKGSRKGSSAWPKPEPQLVIENDGRMRLYRPQAIDKRVEKIIADVANQKLDKDGNPPDPLDRWKKVDKAMRAPVEEVLGAMPIGTLADIPLDQAVAYSCRDSDASLRLARKLREELERQDLMKLMSDGMEVLPIFEEMQATGMPASRRYFERLSEEMLDEMMVIQARISYRYYNDKPFNPGSPKQVGSLLRRRGLKAMKRTTTGDWSTAKPSIEHLRYTDEAFADVFDWRERQHIRDSFCAPVLERIPEGRDIEDIRCQIKTTRTATRRLAAADPNLLNIPTRTELGRRVRKGYICPEGEMFGAWDYGQIEARAFAHESEDVELCKLFNEGRDIHKETAARLFNVRLCEVTYEQRYVGKTINFGVFYGLQADGLSVQLRKAGIEGWDKARCAKAIRDWFKLYKGAMVYIKRVEEELKASGEVRDHWGMPRSLPGIWSQDREIAAEAARIAVSHRIQGFAQGMLQNAMKWLKRPIRELQEVGIRVRWALQVHDEIVLRFQEDAWECVNGIVLEGMIEHCGVELRVPVIAEGAMAKSWGELKE